MNPTNSCIVVMDYFSLTYLMAMANPLTIQQSAAAAASASTPSGSGGVSKKSDSADITKADAMMVGLQREVRSQPHAAIFQVWLDLCRGGYDTKSLAHAVTRAYTVPVGSTDSKRDQTNSAVGYYKRAMGVPGDLARDADEVATRVWQLLTLVREVQNARNDDGKKQPVLAVDPVPRSFIHVDPALVALKFISAMRGGKFSKLWFAELSALVSDYFVPMVHLCMTSETLTVQPFRSEHTPYYNSERRKEAVEIIERYREQKLGTDFAAFLEFATGFGLEPNANAGEAEDGGKATPPRRRMPRGKARTPRGGGGGRGVSDPKRMGAGGAGQAAGGEEDDGWVAVDSPAYGKPRPSSKDALSSLDWRSKPASATAAEYQKVNDVSPSIPKGVLYLTDNDTGEPMTITDRKADAGADIRQAAVSAAPKTRIQMQSDIDRFYRFFPPLTMKLKHASAAARDLLFSSGRRYNPITTREALIKEAVCLQADFVDSDSAKRDDATGWTGTRWNRRHVESLVLMLGASLKYMKRCAAASEAVQDGSHMSFLTRKFDGKTVNAMADASASTKEKWIEYVSAMKSRLRFLLDTKDGIFKSELEETDSAVNVLLSLYDSRSHYNHPLASNLKTWVTLRVNEWGTFERRWTLLSTKLNTRLVDATLASVALPYCVRVARERNSQPLRSLLTDAEQLSTPATRDTALRAPYMPAAAITYAINGIQSGYGEMAKVADQRVRINAMVAQFEAVSYTMLQRRASLMTSTFIMHQTLLTRLFQEVTLHYFKSAFCEHLKLLERSASDATREPLRITDRDSFAKEVVNGSKTLGQMISVTVRSAEAEAVHATARSPTAGAKGTALSGVRLSVLLDGLRLPSKEFSFANIIAKAATQMYTYGHKHSEECYQMRMSGTSEPSVEIHILQQQTQLLIRSFEALPKLFTGLKNLTDVLLRDALKDTAEKKINVVFKDLISMKASCEANLSRALTGRLKTAYGTVAAIPQSVFNLAYGSTREWYGGTLVAPDNKGFNNEREFGHGILALVSTLVADVVLSPNISLIV